MGACRVPYTGTTTTTEVYFDNGEIIDMPLHINKADDSPDVNDIFIDMSGSPDSCRKVEMGESRKTSGGSDKYTSPANVMSLFEDGIYFDQPDVRITDEAAVQSKINRFRDSTAISPISYRFTPADRLCRRHWYNQMFRRPARILRRGRRRQSPHHKQLHCQTLRHSFQRQHLGLQYTWHRQ